MDKEILDRFDQLDTKFMGRMDSIDRKLDMVLRDHERRISRIEGIMKIGIPIFVASISVLIGVHLLI